MSQYHCRQLKKREPGHHSGQGLEEGNQEAYQKFEGKWRGSEDIWNLDGGIKYVHEEHKTRYYHQTSSI